uniref:Uncharacterized protein n=1 Tax=uncultured Thiotrichaceae bacterium TaxID=298394 RepID=A0A6S6UCT7_9GAMM|nr:MAG: Unknown protein [uncultured Thiotrichaceae bacterium]
MTKTTNVPSNTSSAFVRLLKRSGAVIRLLLMAQVMLLWSTGANADVWQAQNRWDDNWERRYQHWVKTQWTEDIFMNPSKPPLYKYETDCSDASYAMRLIFSFENRLPFVVNDPSRPGQLISNRKSTWDNLSQGHRLRMFLDFMADMTSTKSLSQDTFPVALNDIKPGDIYVAPGVHSYQIVNVTETGIAEVMASTTPKKSRHLLKTPSFPFYVPEDKQMLDGYRRFKTPANILRPAHQQPGYSEEQFRLAADLGFDYVKFTDIVARKLGRRPELPDEKTTRLLLALCMYANDRSVYVYDALWHLQKIRREGRHCMTQREYDDFSTPSRDKRLGLFFSSIRHHIERIGRFDPNSRPARWAKAVFSNDQPPQSEMEHLNQFCMVQLTLGEELYMPLRELRENLERGRLVSDPHAPLQYRWGIARNAYRAECRTY